MDTIKRAVALAFRLVQAAPFLDSEKFLGDIGAALGVLRVPVGADLFGVFRRQDSTADHDLAVQFGCMEGRNGLFHALEGGRHQGGQADQMHVLLPDGVHDRLHRHVAAQVDDLKAVVFEDDLHDVLADVVDVPLDRGDDDAALALAGAAFFGDGRLDLLKGALGGAGRLQHCGR